MTTMNNEDPADPSVHEQMREAVAAERERRCPGLPDPHCNYLATCCTICNKCGRQHAPASDLPQPAAWVRNWTSPQPDCVTSLKYRSAADADRGVEYHPAYTADQMRAATAALAAYQAQDNAHRSAQAAVYAALGPGADPDRATWPDQIRALRERADAADTVAQGAAQVRG